MRISKRAVVIPDQHFPIHDQKAVDCALAIIKFLKPSIFINLGDVGEWETVSAWKYKGKRLPPLEYQLPLVDKEIAEVNKGIDQFDKVLDQIKCKNRYILAGNHDEWLDSFANNKVGNHNLLDEYTFRKACKWKERGYKYYSYNEPLKIGKVNFIHGAYATCYHAKKHLEAYGSNIIYGHTHDIQRHTLTKLDSGTIGAWAMGCLKDMSAERNKWLRGRLHNWNHAVGIVDWFSNGNFKVEVVEIVDGTTSIWGKVINAKKKP
jgi:predicted phosphodiesterase